MTNWRDFPMKCVCPFCGFFTYRPKVLLDHVKKEHGDAPFEVREQLRSELYRRANELGPPEPRQQDPTLRKLMRIGNGRTIAVSLPKGWAKSNGIGAGDRVRVVWDGNGTVTVQKVEA